MCSSLLARAVEFCQSRWRSPRSLTLPSSLATRRARVQANTPGLCQSDLHKWELPKTKKNIKFKVSKEESNFHLYGMKWRIWFLLAFFLFFNKCILKRGLQKYFLIYQRLIVVAWHSQDIKKLCELACLLPPPNIVEIGVSSIHKSRLHDACTNLRRGKAICLSQGKQSSV